VPSGSFNSCSTLASVPTPKIESVAGTHHLLERLDGLLAADEERNDHMRENNYVPQREHRISPAFTGCQERLRFGGACHGPYSLL
jgi:hypothetical protein